MSSVNSHILVEVTILGCINFTIGITFPLRICTKCRWVCLFVFLRALLSLRAFKLSGTKPTSSSTTSESHSYKNSQWRSTISTSRHTAGERRLIEDQKETNSKSVALRLVRAKNLRRVLPLEIVMKIHWIDRYIAVKRCPYGDERVEV